MTPASTRRRPDSSRSGLRGDAPRVLMVSSEIYPLAKTGGLADVCGSLPPALAGMGIDTRLLMPGYAEAMDRVIAPRLVADLGEVLPGAHARLVCGWAPDSGLPIWLVDSPALYQRPGTLYQDPQGNDWPDNALRFGVLSHVAAQLALGQAGTGWIPDVVHAHDWHTGLVPLLIQLGGAQRPHTVFTVHNAAFQGNVSLDWAPRLGIPPQLVNPEGVEFYGHLSLLKAGIRYADKVTTVSPTYAREICTPQFGFGLEGLFQARRADLLGIMNGIDAQLWNPSTDPVLTQRYSRADIVGKQSCKVALQRELGLHENPSSPLAVCVSRLTHQKMADVLLEHLPDMMRRHPRLQFALHGRGERRLEQGFERLAQQYPGRASVRIGYSEIYAHHLHAGADILLHGSRFEPCGLTQMYAMRYGTIPVVSRVGGLADSVRDVQPQTSGRAPTGFVFDAPTGEAMTGALERCVSVYENQPEAWSVLQRAAMAGNFGWARSARAYARLYAGLVPGRDWGFARSATPVRAARMPLPRPSGPVSGGQLQDGVRRTG